MKSFKHWLISSLAKGALNLSFVFFIPTLPCFSADPPYEHPISSETWEKCEQFINSTAKALFSTGQTYIPAESTGFCPIEYDPQNSSIFIHLKEIPGGYLGEGAHKIVSKSILYGDFPKIVARCESDGTALKEAEILKNFIGKRGVIQFFSLISRTAHKADLMVQYCNSGSLKSMVAEEWKANENELLLIMYDLLCGLKNIHDLGFIHRDLHPRNILLHREKGHIRAVINDLGSARKVDFKHPSKPGHISGCKGSPEELLQDVLPSIDPRKSEAYVLGISLYVLLFHEIPSWADHLEHIDIAKYSSAERIDLFKQIELHYQKSLTKFVRGTKSGIRKEAAMVVFKLLEPDPTHRIYLDTARSEIKTIAKKWKQNLMSKS